MLLQVGSYIGLDDAWQEWKKAPHSKGHGGQFAMLHELVVSGDWAPVLVPHAPRGTRVERPSFKPWLQAIADVRKHALPGDDDKPN